MATSGSLGTYFELRVPQTQSRTSDAALQGFMRVVTTEVNRMAMQSVFSFSDPNSNVTALKGTWGQNLSSAASCFWIKQLGSGNTGWVALA